MLCRDIGHNWLDHTAELDRRSRVFVRTLICLNCSTQKIQGISIHDGKITKGWYRYPDGYVAEGHRILSSDVRLARLTNRTD